MTFSLHAGHAAQMGYRAAQLASDGFTGDQAVFEGELNYGAVSTPGDGYEPEALRPTLDEGWGVSDIGLKAYPCARVPQAAMDGLRELLEEEDLQPEDVQEVIVQLDSSLSGILDRPDPDDWIAARGSIEFCLAVVLAEGTATIEHFSDDYVTNGPVRDHLPNITPRYDEEFGPSFSKYGARVTVRRGDGVESAREVHHAPGSPANPLGPERRRRKFLECASPRFGAGVSEQLYDSLMAIEDSESVGVMLSLLHEA
jgi:2-methylcitrate dehydratase PrpD